MKIKKNKRLLAVLIIVAVVIAGLIIQNKSIVGLFSKSTDKSSSSSAVPAVGINYGNIKQILSRSSLVRDLPEDSVLLLRFYNFNSGERQWEKSYILRKEGVKEGHIENSDITITLHSKYLIPLTNRNFCSIVQQAKANGDLGISSELSKAKLLWKFKSMYKYRDCLGF